MDNFVCTIDSVIYHSEDQGFAILSASMEKPSGKVTLLIDIPEVNLGTTIDVEGEWVTSKKYGRQFKVNKWEEVLPTTKKGIERYLCSDLIKGIGPVTARLIVERFGESALDVIDSHSKELLSIRGMSQKRAEMVWTSWDKQKDLRDIMVFLKKYNITTGIGVKIYKTYENKTIEQLQTNPYQLIYDVDGIGFILADEIAGKLGFSKTDPLRISSALYYTLSTYCDDQGDTYLPRNILTSKTCNLIQLSKELVEERIQGMIEEGDLIEDNGRIILPKIYHCERNIAEDLYYRATTPTNFLFDENYVDVERLQMYTNIEYEKEQEDAIRKAVASPVIVITGGPGTGKTTITHGIVTALHNLGMSILLAAPTGKAADRLSEATGMEAKTIHRLLGAKPGGTYTHNEDNPLSGDVLVVDEMSMVNVYLMNSLLKAVPPHMRLVLIGDVDQLPCIGPGNILSDLIASGKIPVIRLTKIFRQSENSQIILNAHAINRGEMPYTPNTEDSDFFFMREKDDEKLNDDIVGLVCDRLPKKYDIDPKEIQVLTPMKKNNAGSIQLNKMLQERINPIGPEIKHGDTIFRLGDKVIQTKNNYEKDIFNGDTGIINSVNMEDKTLTVDFGDSVIFYDQTDLDELMLSYALTIHKSQGSEYPFVVIPLTCSHYYMLSKNLIYTGVTRAKKFCILVGQKEAFNLAFSNNKNGVRNTLLKERIVKLAS